jgi:outer membrane cobalamin receptor
VQVRADYPLANRLDLYGRIENLTDERYEQAASTAPSDATATVGVRAKF